MKRIFFVIFCSVFLTGGMAAQECDVEGIGAEFSARLAEAESVEALREVHAELGAALDECGAVAEVPDDAVTIEREAGADFIDFHSEGDFYVLEYETEPGGFMKGGLGVSWDPAVRLHGGLKPEGRIVNFVREGDYTIEFSPYADDAPWSATIYRFPGADPLVAREWSGGPGVLDYIGPLELEGGSYVLEYELTQSDGGSFQLFWASARREFLDQVLILADDDTSGRELVTLEGGTYFINVESRDLEWSFSLTKR